MWRRLGTDSVIRSSLARCEADHPEVPLWSASLCRRPFVVPDKFHFMVESRGRATDFQLFNEYLNPSKVGNDAVDLATQ
ncbi:hypothetical protein E2C01_093321 [Portunus trituberculatus]|uniref:Uncharacterized protein n=1 Tax=Portunus trituberculatus TaxID=210409 RepID=A0A5B7K070_PORTR|nr:hypothetical protein [Portunus trituberculatus]